MKNATNMAQRSQHGRQIAEKQGGTTVCRWKTDSDGIRKSCSTYKHASSIPRHHYIPVISICNKTDGAQRRGICTCTARWEGGNKGGTIDLGGLDCEALRRCVM